MPHDTVVSGPTAGLGIWLEAGRSTGVVRFLTIRISNEAEAPHFHGHRLGVHVVLSAP